MKGENPRVFSIWGEVKSVFLALGDFIFHERCTLKWLIMFTGFARTVPLYFKIAALRHASALYADRDKLTTGSKRGVTIIPLMWILRM